MEGGQLHLAKDLCQVCPGVIFLLFERVRFLLDCRTVTGRGEREDAHKARGF